MMNDFEEIILPELKSHIFKQKKKIKFMTSNTTTHLVPNHVETFTI